MANLGFNPNIPNAGFQAGQSMHVQGAGSGMLMDLVAEWKKQRGEQRAFQQEKELVDDKLSKQPQEWKPQSMGEALSFARGKEGIDPDYEINLNNAIVKIGEGKNPWEIYQTIAQMYPKKSAELKRILIPGKDEENDFDSFFD